MDISYPLHLFAKYGSPFLSVIEKALLKKPETTDNGKNIIFLVGPPRSGSTLIYQYITNIYKVIYVDNLVDMFYRNPRIGSALSRIFFNDKPHNCYKSNLGNTQQCGLHAPSESGRLWYKWFPKNSTGSANLITEIETDLANALNCAIGQAFLRYQQPLVFKNLMTTLRLQAIAKVWPDAKIIRIKRNIIDTALSIREARLKANNDPQKWWSVVPPEYQDLQDRPWPEQIIGQILAIEKHVERDITRFKHHAEIRFENFKERPEKEINNVWGILRIQPIKRHSAKPILIGEKEIKNKKTEEKQMLENALVKMQDYYA